MCYTVAYLEKRAQTYAARYSESVGKQAKIDLPENDLKTNYFFSGFEHPYLPIVKHEGICLHQWGLIPNWINNIGSAFDIRKKTLNAVGETIFEKASFKKSILTKRCLIGIKGFFEWRSIGRVKYPYFIQAKDNEYTTLGGVYNEWINKETGEIFPTFSIITTPANPLMEKIHNSKKRMPLILPEECEKEWLNPSLSEAQIKELIVPIDERKLMAYTVTSSVNSPKNNRNTPNSIQQFEYPELVFFEN